METHDNETPKAVKNRKSLGIGDNSSYRVHQQSVGLQCICLTLAMVMMQQPEFHWRCLTAIATGSHALAIQLLSRGSCLCENRSQRLVCVNQWENKSSFPHNYYQLWRNMHMCVAAEYVSVSNIGYSPLIMFERQYHKMFSACCNNIITYQNVVLGIVRSSNNV